MDLSFLPDRQNMYKEVQQWIMLKKLDMLLGLCNCCTNKVFGQMMARHCRTCHVRNGIVRLTRRETREPVESEELLGVC
jgi:hypothetical protein